MTPLEIRIVAGLEDTGLEKHIRALESFERRSEGEERTLARCYERLDLITDPNFFATDVHADPRLGLK